jgi:hypothetical protein
MKTFRELISWELEQEKQTHRPLPPSFDDPSSRLSSYVSRKRRYLSAARSQPWASASARPA